MLFEMNQFARSNDASSTSGGESESAAEMAQGPTKPDTRQPVAPSSAEPVRSLPEGRIPVAATAADRPDAAAPMRGPLLTSAMLRRRSRRRVALPLMLFAITCVSTFWAGATHWQPMYFDASVNFRQIVLRNWDQGLIYMVCVVSILMMHEMGHFVATLIYRIPASLPVFIPFPGSPVGTMGAVIAMDGQRANRRQIFDVGIAGPLAGLCVAVPVLWIGIGQMDVGAAGYGAERYDCPLLIEWMAHWLHPNKPTLSEVRASQINAYFMAGWVGLLITGLNMLPVSQLDGGHVIYSLFGRRAHWIARAFVFVAILFAVFGNAIGWSLMIILVILMGIDHPPTADDTARLGPFRIALGLASLIIPVLCFPPYAVRIDTF
jgi:membrane-associated protease RseP (regulator of RpoE activity)